MDYNLPERYKVYIKIINLSFDYCIDIKNEEIIKEDANYGVVVSGDVSTINSKDVFNTIVHYFHHHVSIHNIFYFRGQMGVFNKKSCNLCFHLN